MLKPSLLVSACLFGTAVGLLAMPHSVRKRGARSTHEPHESGEPFERLAADTSGSEQEPEPPEEESLDPPRVKVGSDGLIPTEKSIAMFEARVRRNAKDTRSRVVLAALYMRWSKETHNHQALHKAEAQLRHVLKLSPDSLSALTQLGRALLAQHKFAQALETANRVLTFDAKHPSALAIQGDAYLELGSYDKAGESYRKLAAVEQNSAVTVRMAHLAELTGKTDEAARLLKQAHQEILDADATDRTLAWYELRIATFELNRGDLETAGTHFRKALDLLPDYIPALEGLASVEAANENLDQAETLLQRAEKLHHRPATMAKLSGLLSLQGKTTESDDWLAQAHEKLSEESKDDPELHYREFSQFLSDHDRDPEQALDMARKDLKVRRDVFAYDTLAWAQFRNKQFEAASHNIAQALAQRTADAELHLHAALIHDGLGDKQKSVMHLERAFEINPHFPIDLAPETRSALSQLEEVARTSSGK